MSTAESGIYFSDLALSRRLERAEGESNARFVEARARLFPESGAGWIEMAGAYAMFDGIGSPLTQTFGLGMAGTVTAEDLTTIEKFFLDRRADVHHEVSPLAHPSVLTLLNERSYRPIEFTSVMFRPLGLDDRSKIAIDETLRVRRATRGDADLYAQTSARGWSHMPELGAFFEDIGRVAVEAEGYVPLLVEKNGRPVAAGAMSLAGGVGLLAGASTVPEARRQGVQRALLTYRLRYAAEHGCDIAMMGAAPGSDSQRNAERVGFRMAYTRIKWRLPHRK
jgi:GNAT superfamily N-acetyltransferase